MARVEEASARRVVDKKSMAAAWRKLGQACSEEGLGLHLGEIRSLVRHASCLLQRRIVRHDDTCRLVPSLVQ